MKLDKSKNFFFLSSENAQNAKSQLFGFAFAKNGFFHNCDMSERDIQSFKENSSGAYVFVSVADKKIRILRDGCGSFGLFVYKKNEYWAISNSFYCLIENLDRPVSLNFNYAANLFIEHFATFTSTQTLCSEIFIPYRDEFLEIDKSSSQLNLLKTNQKKQSTISIDSPNAIAIVDEWINRYTSIIEYLIEQNECIQFDVSGGFDSRISLALSVAANVDHSKVFYYSDNINPVYRDDFRVANLLADMFGFKLNSLSTNRRSIPVNGQTVFEVYKNTRLGFHKALSANANYFSGHKFGFGGEGGEAQRGAWRKNLDWYLQRNHYTKDRSFLVDYSARSLIQDMKLTATHLNSKLESEIMNELYVAGRCRNHFGTDITRSSTLNNIRFSPLLDPLLFQIDPTCGGKYHSLLMYAVIMKRIDGRLLKIPFDNKRSYPEGIAEKAEDIISSAPKRKISKSDNYFFKISVSDYPEKKPNEQDESFEKILNRLYHMPHIVCIIKYVMGETAYKVGESKPELADTYKIKSTRSGLLAIAKVVFEEMRQFGLINSQAKFDENQNLEDIKNSLSLIKSAEERKDPLEVKAVAEDVINLYPTLVSPLIRQARILLEEGKISPGLEMLEKIKKIHGETALIRSEIAEAYIKLKKWDEAITNYYAAMILDEKNGFGRVRLCNILQQLGRIDEALVVCEAGIELDPSSETLKKKLKVLNDLKSF